MLWRSECKGIALPCKGSFGGGGLRWECGFVVIGDFTIIKVHLFRPAYVLNVYAFILINNNNNNNNNLVYAFIPIHVFSCIPISITIIIIYI